MKGYSTFPKSSGMELHHQMVSCRIQDICWWKLSWDAVGVFYSSSLLEKKTKVFVHLRNSLTSSFYLKTLVYFIKENLLYSKVILNLILEDSFMFVCAWVVRRYMSFIFWGLQSQEICELPVFNISHPLCFPPPAAFLLSQGETSPEIPAL